MSVVFHFDSIIKSTVRFTLRSLNGISLGIDHKSTLESRNTSLADITSTSI